MKTLNIPEFDWHKSCKELVARQSAKQKLQEETYCCLRSTWRKWERSHLPNFE